MKASSIRHQIQQRILNEGTSVEKYNRLRDIEIEDTTELRAMNRNRIKLDREESNGRTSIHSK